MLCTSKVYRLHSYTRVCQVKKCILEILNLNSELEFPEYYPREVLKLSEFLNGLSTAWARNLRSRVEFLLDVWVNVSLTTYSENTHRAPYHPGLDGWSCLSWWNFSLRLTRGVELIVAAASMKSMHSICAGLSEPLPQGFICMLREYQRHERGNESVLDSHLAEFSYIGWQYCYLATKCY